MITQPEQAKKMLMNRKLENMRVEAELSFQERDYEDALIKQSQILKHSLSSGGNPKDVYPILRPNR